MRPASMNCPGPHRKDIDLFIKSVDSMYGCYFVSEKRASTGTVYIEIELDTDPDNFDAPILYKTVRFASHADAHANSDYTVASGKAAPSAKEISDNGYGSMGYDGRVGDAIEWVKGLL